MLIDYWPGFLGRIHFGGAASCRQWARALPVNAASYRDSGLGAENRDAGKTPVDDGLEKERDASAAFPG